jgi:hypothetical protein
MIIIVAKYLMLAIFSYMSRKSIKKVIKQFESFNRYSIGRNYFQSHMIFDVLNSLFVLSTGYLFNNNETTTTFEHILNSIQFHSKTV